MKETDWSALARLVGVSERAVMRLAGSILLARPTASGAEGPSVSVAQRDIGLRLQEITQRGSTPAMLEDIALAIKEYRATCPRVVDWIARGDFQPDRPDPQLEEAHLIHAVSTAGRLRARILRRFGM